ATDRQERRRRGSMERQPEQPLPEAQIDDGSSASSLAIGKGSVCQQEDNSRDGIGGEYSGPELPEVRHQTRVIKDLYCTDWLIYAGYLNKT
uniref:Uncharacterized protein n=1 Tax=Aegilops tauschii subsp. strangulata TaxID=200361 RepID=A0A453L9K1_AEGTS